MSPLLVRCQSGSYNVLKYEFIHHILQVYLEKTCINSQTVYHQAEYI